ncbi:hypothetical protein C0993_005369 [Termitomyces sp. T159_Od127]|nr:hypothetical protein C0993_005369 [Termitomyces sp. T159_Od127]
MANHGYIARDGKNIGLWGLIRGLRACYSLSAPLAGFLAVGGFVLLRRVGRVDLYDVGEHGRIEHDASLVHRDTPAGERYAPIEVEEGLVERLVGDARTGSGSGGEGRAVMDAWDVARARVRREKQSPRLDFMHAEIARGEMAIILGVWETRAGGDVGVPVEWMREWMGRERLPKEWERPTHVQGLFDVVRRARSIRLAMQSLEKAEREGRDSS